MDRGTTVVVPLSIKEKGGVVGLAHVRSLWDVPDKRHGAVDGEPYVFDVQDGTTVGDLVRDVESFYRRRSVCGSIAVFKTFVDGRRGYSYNYEFKWNKLKLVSEHGRATKDDLGIPWAVVRTGTIYCADGCADCHIEV